MGETLHEVRLQQLQVRNAQYQEKIDEKNQELLQLKLTSGKTVQVLSFYRVSELPSTPVLPFFCFQGPHTSSCILPFSQPEDPLPSTDLVIQLGALPNTPRAAMPSFMFGYSLMMGFMFCSLVISHPRGKSL